MLSGAEERSSEVQQGLRLLQADLQMTTTILTYKKNVGGGSIQDSYCAGVNLFIFPFFQAGVIM
jgi:hypothetical protein